MTISPQQFRVDYNEFNSSVTYPNSALSFWLDIAYRQLNADRWGTSIDIGAELFVAHHLSIEARAQAESQAGGIPGGQVGPINSKSVDKVSIGYDTGAGIQPDAGHWNLTVYGTRFIRMARMMGAGPLFIGVGAVPAGNGLAWPGPSTIPSVTGFA